MLATAHDSLIPGASAIAVLAAVIGVLVRTLWGRGSSEQAVSTGWQTLVAAKDVDLARQEAELLRKDALIEQLHATNAKLAAELAALRVEGRPR